MNNVRDHNEIAARPSPTGHLTGLPISPPQPRWQGGPPLGVDAVLTRNAALDGPHHELFAPWASNLALLNSQFVQQVWQTGIEQPSSVKSIDTHWSFVKPLGFAECGVECNVGRHLLWSTKLVAGWSVELRYPCDVDARVLTIANMPILCRDLNSAARLAVANYPCSGGGLIWRSCR
jgi:hypothetical protein